MHSDARVTIVVRELILFALFVALVFWAAKESLIMAVGAGALSFVVRWFWLSGEWRRAKRADAQRQQQMATSR